MPAITRPTIRQKKAFDFMVEGSGTKGEALVKAGYSEATAQTPTKVTDSVGWQMLLAEAGLTPSLIVNSLTADIKAKPKQRVGELRLGADLLGLIKRGDNPSIAIQVNVNELREKYK